MKRTVKVVSLLLIVILLLSACHKIGSDEKNKNALIGKWVLSSDFDNHGNRIPKDMEFFSDNTVMIESYSNGTYSIDGDSLKIALWAMEAYTYTFIVSEDTLELKCTGSDIHDNVTYIYYSSDSESFEGNEGSNLSNNGASDLALSCDAILASGTEPNGDLYEMVAIQEETAADVTLKVGFIKNGEWLREPTNDMVFFENKYSSLNDYKLNEKNYFSLDYCGFGVFTNHSSYYNSETDKSVTLRRYRDSIPDYYYLDAISPSKDDSERQIVIACEGKHTHTLSLEDSAEYNLYSINIKNMTVERIDNSVYVGWYTHLYGLSNGLFAVRTIHNVLDDDEVGNEYLIFYNTAGEKVIDLSDYHMDLSRSDEGFVDGKYMFVAVNENDNWFKVTIDKTGKVISEEKIES